MNKVAAKCRIDRAVNVVKLAKRQHTTRIKAVGIRNPVVDLGGGKLPRTRFNRRCRPWPRARCHGRNRRQGRQAVVKAPSAIDSSVDTQRGKDSPQPLQPAAWRCDRVLIPERPRDDHLRRADRHPDVMGTEPGTPVVRLKARGLAHLGVHPWVDFRAWRPVAFIEAAEDQSIRALHTGFYRSQNGKPRMRLPGPPHRPCRHHLRQNLREGTGVGLETPAMLGKRSQKCRSRFPVLVGPYMERAVGGVGAAIIQRASRCHRLRCRTKGPCQRCQARRRTCPCLEIEGKRRCQTAFNKSTEFVVSGKAFVQSRQAGGEPVAAQYRHLEFIDPAPKL